MDQTDDFYSVLGVSKTANAEELKTAYRREALKNHPDRNPDRDTSERFKLIGQAYDTLRDSSKRTIYDFNQLQREGSTHQGARQARGHQSSSSSSSSSQYHYQNFYQNEHASSSESERNHHRAWDDFFRRSQEAWNDQYNKTRQGEDPDEMRKKSEFVARMAEQEDFFIKRQKETAQVNRSRFARQRAEFDHSKSARRARVLGQFWQTHRGVQWQDMVVLGTFGSVLLFSYYFPLRPPIPKVVNQAPPVGVTSENTG